MIEFSQGATLAWRIAAAEAAAGRHPRIDRAHLLVGILSLGKALVAASDLPPDDRAELQGEATRVEDVFVRLGLQPPTLRRSLRERLGYGTHRHGSQATISRTEACKGVFARAIALAEPAEATTLHLVAALAEDADPYIDPLLRDAGVKPAEVRRLALAMALLGSAAAALQSQHGVHLSIDPEAERHFASLEDTAAAVERWVETPLEELVRSGKLRRHPAWRVVHEEGGIYVIPA